jgi:hypothetical protein
MSFLGKLTGATFRTQPSKSTPMKKIYTEKGMRETVMSAVTNNWIVYQAICLNELLGSKQLHRGLEDPFINNCIVTFNTTPYTDIQFDYDSDEDMSVDPESESLRDIEEAEAAVAVAKQSHLQDQDEDVLIVTECKNKTRLYTFNGVTVPESVAKNLKARAGVKTVVRVAKHKTRKTKRKRR